MWSRAAATLASASPSLCVRARVPPASAAIGAVRWATSKAGGSSKNGRDSRPKFLGVKKYGREAVEPGNIILRQRGARYGIVESTASVAFGKDYTVYALKPGFVKFWWHPLKKKYFVEVVKSLGPVPDGVGGALEAVVKHPIVRLKEWEMPQLLKLVDAAAAGKGAPVSLSAEMEARLGRFREALAAGASSGGRGPGSHAAAAKAAATGAAAAAAATTTATLA
jgi:ribosomal protein L27